MEQSCELLGSQTIAFPATGQDALCRTPFTQVQEQAELHVVGHQGWSLEGGDCHFGVNPFGLQGLLGGPSRGTGDRVSFVEPQLRATELRVSAFLSYWDGCVGVRSGLASPRPCIPYGLSEKDT